jgi:predicted DsbA family dithiol-disulfide isomerase
MTHAELAPIVAANASRVRVIRKQVPLTRIHPHALDAARAACCGELLGKGDAMADALFSAPVEDLTPEGCEKIALSLGLDIDAYRKCVSDPKTDERIRADEDAFRASGGRGLPTIWIDETKLEGAQDGPELERVVRAAIARKS